MRLVIVMRKEIGYFSPPNLLGGDIALYKEYSNKETFEGEVIRASLTKAF